MAFEDKLSYKPSEIALERMVKNLQNQGGIEGVLKPVDKQEYYRHNGLGHFYHVRGADVFLSDDLSNGIWVHYNDCPECTGAGYFFKILNRKRAIEIFE